MYRTLGMQQEPQPGAERRPFQHGPGGVASEGKAYGSRGCPGLEFGESCLVACLDLETPQALHLETAHLSGNV